MGSQGVVSAGPADNGRTDGQDGRQDGRQAPAPEAQPLLLPGSRGRQDLFSRNPLSGVGTSGRAPEDMLQGLKFPLVFAQKCVAGSAKPLLPLPACLWSALEHSRQSRLLGWCGEPARGRTPGGQDSVLARLPTWHRPAALQCARAWGPGSQPGWGWGQGRGWEGRPRAPLVDILLPWRDLPALRLQCSLQDRPSGRPGL